MKKENKKINETYDFDIMCGQAIESQYYKEINKRINKQKKQNKINRFLSIFVGAFVIFATCSLLVLYDKLGNEAQKNCEELHSHNYCVNHI